MQGIPLSQKAIGFDTSSVTTDAISKDGRNITLLTPELIHMTDSEITSSVGGGMDTAGGNIHLDSRFIVLDSSEILANAFEGIGRNLTLGGEVVLTNPLSSLDASSTLSIDGDVDIQAAIRNLSGTIASLPREFQQASTLFAER